MYKRTITIAFLLISGLALVQASSAPQRPLKRLSQPTVHALEIIPRSPLQRRSSQHPSQPPIPVHSTDLQHSDSFRLTLSAFGKEYHLHLSPNPDILHPSARINYYTTAPDGKTVLDRTEPLSRSDVKAYWGDVLHPGDTHDRLREDIAGGLVYSQTPRLGWARIMVHHQGDIDAGNPPIFEGAFSADGVVHHVMTKDNYLRTKLPLDPHPDSSHGDLVIFRDSDILTSNEVEAQRFHSGFPSSSLQSDDTFVPDSSASTCSHDSLEWNTDPWLNPALRRPSPPTFLERLGFRDDLVPTGINTSIFNKREDIAGGDMSTNFADKIGQTAGCPISQKIVYMGVAADCKYIQQYGSPQNATSSILNDWNTASALYKSTFNVSLGIIELEMHDSTCPSPPDQTRPWNVDCGSVTLNDRLSLFSQWRGNKGADGTGLWHLMSGCPTGTEVGVAWLGTLCQSTAGGSSGNIVSGTAVSTGGRAEWQVVAHEIGHNFGAIHDCTSGCNSSSPCCPLTTSSCDSSSQFLMSPTSSLDEVKFSQCSLGNICSMLQPGKMNTTCLQEPDPKKQTISLKMCGNGIVEDGEDCDPGKGSNSTCCDPATCKFTPKSVCDPASSTCCTKQCQFAPSTQVCRPSQDDRCDMAETCTGNSSSCPWDKTKPNGQSCGSDGLACASGKCTSLAQQCQSIGASMGLQAACPTKGDSSCRVSCQDPQQSNQCIMLQAQLVDGSPCGFGGSCQGGRCQPGGLFDTAKSWYLQNLQISIPVTVVVGIVVLFLLYGLFRCMTSCCCARERVLPPTPGGPRQVGGWIGPPMSVPQRTNSPERIWVPPAAGSIRRGREYARLSDNGIPASLRAAPNAGRRYRQQPSSSQQQGNWVDATAYNGPPRY